MTTAVTPRTDYHQIAAHARWELDRLTDHARREVDAFADWAEQQAAQAKAELTELCDELGAPYHWVVLPERQLSPASLVRQTTLDNLVRNNRPPGWTPRPEDFAPAPADDMPGREAGPRGRYTRAADNRLARLEAWLRARFTPVKEEQ